VSGLPSPDAGLSDEELAQKFQVRRRRQLERSREVNMVNSMIDLINIDKHIKTISRPTSPSWVNSKTIPPNRVW
jgi:hypothetical protein